MSTRKVLLVSLLVLLYGCQKNAPEKPLTPETPAAAPVAPIEPAASAAPAKSAAPAAPIEPAASAAPAKSAAPAAPAAPVAPVAPAASVASVASVAPAASIAITAPVRMAMPEAGKKCLACHAEATKVVGPSFNDVGTKYKGDKDAVSKITSNIMSGGQFGWKAPMRMPPKGGTNLTDDEVKAMAAYIAGLAY